MSAHKCFSFGVPLLMAEHARYLGRLMGVYVVPAGVALPSGVVWIGKSIKYLDKEKCHHQL